MSTREAIERATAADSDAITHLVREAYEPYVETIGQEPAPMHADYKSAIEAGQVHICTHDGELAGVIVTEASPAHFSIENVAVASSARGTGVGARLLEFAEGEALRLGLSEVRLYTNAKMTANLDYYPRRGYRRTGRRIEDGYDRVFFAKTLSTTSAPAADQRLNEFGQPIGAAVNRVLPAPAPGRVTLIGEHCRLEPLDPDAHAAGLYAAFAAAPDASDWTYMPVGSFASEADYRAWADVAALAQDPLQFTVVSIATGEPLGTLSLLRQDPKNAVVEVGFVAFSRAMQRTPYSTEAHFLFMQYVFDELGYRRYEWKCDALNEPSKRAAERLGFSFEGTFRQATVYKGRSRDTSWFSIIDTEWPDLRAEFTRWLAPENFDEAGVQRTPLRTRS
ncbi:GNAT family N-acetyltransferase [Leucobacter sp. NPDC015123]|uniref:GNAT family N-acetyltransferase n=1 Tax=Leucobacter sp. NPDC015123 TaxID=3364129 RepID=UPI0036F45D62